MPTTELWLPLKYSAGKIVLHIIYIAISIRNSYLYCIFISQHSEFFCVGVTAGSLIVIIKCLKLKIVRVVMLRNSICFFNFQNFKIMHTMARSFFRSRANLHLRTIIKPPRFFNDNKTSRIYIHFFFQ